MNTPSNLNGKMELIKNPYNPSQIIDQRLMIWFVGNPSNIKITLKVDDEQETQPGFIWVNPGITDRAILQIDSAEIPVDGYAHQLTIHAWEEQDGQPSDIAELKLIQKTQRLNVVQPPNACHAILIRSGDDEIPDMTKVTWDHPGAVKITAKYPQLISWKFVIKNEVIGFADHNENQFIVENLGAKFNGISQRDVTFGVIAIQNGAESEPIFATPVLIYPRVKKAEKNPDAYKARAINQTTVMSEIYQKIASERSSMPSNGFDIIRITINQFNKKIKDIVRTGGSVKIDHFGTFKAQWNDDNTERSVSFIPSLGFKEGTKRGEIMTDAEARTS